MGALPKKASEALRSKNTRAKLNWLFIIVASFTIVLVNITVFSPTLCSKSPPAAAQDGNGVVSHTTEVEEKYPVNSKGDDDQGVATTNSGVSELITRLSQHTCTDENITVRCICGADTQPDYLKNMVETYAGSRYDSSLFEKCLDQTLPFDGFTPLECWPKIFIMSSYPTSGNELARSILQKTTKRNMFLSEYKEPSVPGGRESDLYFLKTAGGKKLKILTNICDHIDESRRLMPFGMMGKSTIYKTHGPKGIKWKNTGGQLMNNPQFGGFTTSGIVHLARNPGDHLLRQSFRWKREWGRSCETFQCFVESKYSKEFCDNALEKTLDWSLWHKFWNEKSLTTPQIIYHYENFSNTTLVTQATEKVMDFLNELPPRQFGYSLGDELDGVIKDPEYVHGTLMALVCGKDLAREMHKGTKEVSEQLGYIFDDDSATWSLRE